MAGLLGREDFAGFVYMDLDHPMVAWNTVRGLYCSVSSLPETDRQHVISLSMATMFKSSPERLKSEMAIEAVRLKYFPDHVSRLSGVFVFDDVDSISSLWYGEGWGGHFNDNYMTDVGVSSDRSSRLDANWIAEIMDDQHKLKPAWLQPTMNYWRGQAHPTKSPIWERVVDGWVTIWGAAIKELAVREIHRYWPRSLKLLEYSCHAAFVGSNDGLVVASAIQRPGCLDIDFLLKLSDCKENAVFEAIEKRRKVSPEMFAEFECEPVLATPDFQHLNFSLPFEGSFRFGISEDGRVESNFPHIAK